MSDYNKPRFQTRTFGDKPFRKPFGQRPFNKFDKKGGFNNGPREMFKADCAKCGNVCEVPFRPNGTKPVYCKECFVKDAPMGGDRQPRRDFAPQGQRPDFAPRPDQAFNDLKAELRVVNQNLERLIAAVNSMTAAAVQAPKTEKPEKPAKASKKKAK